MNQTLNLTQALDVFENNLVDIRKACVENVFAIRKQNEPCADHLELTNGRLSVEAIWQYVRWLTIEKETKHYLRTIKRIDARRFPINKNSITDEDIARAKEMPVEELYDDQLFGRKNKTGLCPFHKERTPSFTIFPDNRFKCFGCGESGDSIDFVMKRDGMDFINAVKALGRL